MATIKRIFMCVYIIGAISSYDLVKANDETEEKKIQLGRSLLHEGYSLKDYFIEHAIGPIDFFLNDLIPPIFGSKANNRNGKREDNKYKATKDDYNDEYIYLSQIDLIKTSGFDYELHEAIADDGYLTVMTRIINPLVDRDDLLQPPIIMIHGGAIDLSVYLSVSTMQHNPEKWHRVGEDQPFGSSNRSLALALANNRFDVWLAETRGIDSRFRKRMPKEEHHGIDNTSVAINIKKKPNYWTFTEDDVINYETKSYIDKVMAVTGSKNVSIFTYSHSTSTSLAFLSNKQDYAQKVHALVCMAPIVSPIGMNRLTEFLAPKVCALSSTSMGRLILSKVFLTQNFRRLFVRMFKSKPIRYSLLKSLTTFLFGPSPKYQTNLELNMISHLIQPRTFRYLKRICRFSAQNGFWKFDAKGESKSYNLSELELKSWIIVSATNDAISTPSAIDDLIERVAIKPQANIEVLDYNHLDLIAAFDNDIKVNKPIIEYLISRSYPIEDNDSNGFIDQGAVDHNSRDSGDDYIKDFDQEENENDSDDLNYQKNNTDNFNKYANLGQALNISDQYVDKLERGRITGLDGKVDKIGIIPNPKSVNRDPSDSRKYVNSSKVVRVKVSQY